MSDVEQVIAEAIKRVLDSTYPEHPKQVRDDADELIWLDWSKDREVLTNQIMQAFEIVRSAGYEVTKTDDKPKCGCDKCWGEFLADNPMPVHTGASATKREECEGE